MAGDSDEAYVEDTPSFAIFFLLQQGEPADWVRVWSGAGDFLLPADTTDTAGGLYHGVGFPVGLPSLSQVINGGYETLTFTLSGVDETAARLATVDRQEVNGSLVYVGIVDLDAAQQPTGPCDWLIEGEAGMPKVSRSGQLDGAVRSVTLPVTVAFYDRNLTKVSHWTEVDQHRRSPTDDFCNMTKAYTVGSTVIWPT